jgi:hypothetical protein
MHPNRSNKWSRTHGINIHSSPTRIRTKRTRRGNSKPNVCLITQQSPMQVPIPTRFIYIVLSPMNEDSDVIESILGEGNALGALLCDDVFKHIANVASQRQDIIDAVEHFMQHVCGHTRGYALAM